MSGNGVFRSAILGVTLAAGLGAVVYVAASGPDKVRARAVPVRVAFSAPTSGAPVFRYHAEVNDTTHGLIDTVRDLEFTTVQGPVDSHVIWLMLDVNYYYVVRVRGVSAAGAVGPWSEPSDPYKGMAPTDTPPPDDIDD